ncbi:hypothetical protein WA538_003919, partial [Blastocystis sp. DL]
FQLSDLQEQLNTASQLLQSVGTGSDGKTRNDILSLQLEAELQLAKERESGSYLDEMGISELTEEEKEELLLRDVDSGCTQLKNAIAYYQGCIEKMTEEKQGLAQTNAYLTEMRMELERHSEDNSRQLESLNGNDTSFFERDMDMYKSEHTRLQKANRILIDEIKDLLTICYGNRKSSTNPSLLLSKEILTILEECIQRALSTEATDKYSTLSPEQLSSESIRLLLSCNILQKDPKDSSRVKVVDYSH